MSRQFQRGDTVEVIAPNWGGLRFLVDDTSEFNGQVLHVSGRVIRPASVGVGISQGRADTINRVFRIGGAIGFSTDAVRGIRVASFGRWYKEHS